MWVAVTARGSSVNGAVVQYLVGANSHINKAMQCGQLKAIALRLLGRNQARNDVEDPP
jgi:hypothetical protein